ncbi:MAG: NusA-like transcription termination signal-binding factor [Candidatus Woesearchaeota archaeon]
MKYDLETIQFINLFEKKTQTNVKDCFFENGLLIFIVMPGQASKAVGKQGINVKQLASLINKKIKIVEFNENPIRFIKSYIAPITAEDITAENDVIFIKASSTKDKGMLIGRDANRLNHLKKITQKYYPNVKDIKIV